MNTHNPSPSQKQLLLLAVSFLTRIPVTLNFEISTTALNQASRYFALVGVLLAGILSLGYLVFSYFFHASIAVALVMALGLILTGAFHEDGLADVWDGFGGGWKVEDKLTIMKDSRLGTTERLRLLLCCLLSFKV